MQVFGHSKLPEFVILFLILRVLFLFFQGQRYSLIFITRFFNSFIFIIFIISLIYFLLLSANSLSILKNTGLISSLQINLPDLIEFVFKSVYFVLMSKESCSAIDLAIFGQ